MLRSGLLILLLIHGSLIRLSNKSFYLIDLY
nr:MAG TPA_asm: hypothetical protein [Caudoviricetes sp.]